jgi:hypothetical protein
VLGEGNVTQIQDSTNDFEQLLLLPLGELETSHGTSDLSIINAIVDGGDLVHTRLSQVVVSGRVAGQVVGLQIGCAHSGQHLIEDVEITLSWAGANDTRLLKKIYEDSINEHTVARTKGKVKSGLRTVGNLSSDRSTISLKLDLHVLTEARRVIISEGGGVTEGLQNWVGQQQKLLDTIDLRGAGRHLGDVSHNNLGGLGLSGT